MIMRFQNLQFEDVEWDDDSISLQIKPTDELIDMANRIRKGFGCTDLVEIGANNEVYYNFYLICFPLQTRIKLLFTCNHGYSDDWVDYDLPETPLTDEEIADLMFQVIWYIGRSM